MRRIRIKENIDHRYLGAVCFVDNATRGFVRRSFNIEAKGLTFFINLSCLHVIASAEGLEKHTHSFDSQPDQPAIEKKFFKLTVSDPLQKYLPRIKQIKLPRNPDPDSDSSLFKPIEVSMFPASSISLNPNWSVIRASVFKLGHNSMEMPLKGALLRIVRDGDGKLITSGLADQRGEALIIVPGIPFHNFVTDDEQPDDDDWTATGDVVQKETLVKLEVVVDQTIPWPVDPEVLEEKRNEWLCKFKDNKNGGLLDSVNLKLKTGQTQVIKLFVNVPEGT